jgi:hypothetical protein
VQIYQGASPKPKEIEGKSSIEVQIFEPSQTAYSLGAKGRSYDQTTQFFASASNRWLI